MNNLLRLESEIVPLKVGSFSSTVKDYREYKLAMFKLYTDLPRTFSIKSTVSKIQMETFYEKFNQSLVASDLPNYKLLAHYKVINIGNYYFYTDNSHNKYNAKQIETYINTFVRRFVERVKNLAPIERLKSIYSYIYSNFTYNANGYQYMMVGNAYNYEMACNGFSRLVYELLNATDIKTRIIEGEDHYYNLVSFQDVFEKGVNNKDKKDWFSLDVTTDILLKTPHGATGKTMEDYLAYVLDTKIYTAKPIAKETNTRMQLDVELLEKLKNNDLYTLPNIVIKAC